MPAPVPGHPRGATDVEPLTTPVRVARGSGAGRRSCEAARPRRRRDHRPRRHRPDRGRGPGRLGRAGRGQPLAVLHEPLPEPGAAGAGAGGGGLVDAPGAPLFDELRDGDQLDDLKGTVRRGTEVVARGAPRPRPARGGARARWRARIDCAIADFAANTAEHVSEEGESSRASSGFPHGDELPGPSRPDRGPGTTYRNDLRTLRAYIHDVRPKRSASTAAPTRYSRKGSSRT